jgi:signal peptidase II
VSPTRSRASAEVGGAVTPDRSSTAPTRSGEGQGRSFVLAASVAAVVVALDQLTKWWAVERLSLAGCAVPDGCIELVGSLRFRLVENTGSAFSLGTGWGPLLGVVAAVMAVILLRASHRSSRAVAVVLGLVAGGAVGNLVDRVARADDGLLSGAVIDFVDLQWWPVFNLADAAIVVGVAALAVLSFRDGQGDQG